jgi:hypothetical protein
MRERTHEEAQAARPCSGVGHADFGSPTGDTRRMATQAADACGGWIGWSERSPWEYRAMAAQPR